MIPLTGDLLKRPFTLRRRPSKTYAFEGERIKGTADGLDAVRQAVFCILNTERFEYVIYSWSYGAELTGLYGQPPALLQSKIKKRIREALTQDDRIRSVDAFSFTRKGHALAVAFTVQTVDGSFQAEKEVEINV